MQTSWSSRWLSGVITLFVVGVGLTWSRWGAERFVPDAVRRPGIATGDPLGSEVVATGAVVAVIGLYLLLRPIRAAASAAFMRRCFAAREYRPYRSPVFGWTLLMWLIVAVGSAVAAIGFRVSQIERGQDYRQFDELTVTGYRLGSIAMILVAGIYFSWKFRRRVEVPQAVAGGLVILAERAELPRGWKAFRFRFEDFSKGLLVEAAFIIASIAQILLIDHGRLTGNDWARYVFGIIAGPGGVSSAVLVVLVLWGPSRAGALQALKHPASLTAVGLVIVGYVVYQFGLVIPGDILALVGLLIASATCLQVMELGRQPSTGIMFLGLSWWYGYLTAPNGDSVLPQGWLNWVVAVGALAFCLRDIRGQYRDHLGLIPVAKDPSPLRPSPRVDDPAGY